MLPNDDRLDDQVVDKKDAYVDNQEQLQKYVEESYSRLPALWEFFTLITVCFLSQEHVWRNDKDERNHNVPVWEELEHFNPWEQHQLHDHVYDQEKDRKQNDLDLGPFLFLTFVCQIDAVSQHLVLVLSVK